MRVIVIRHHEEDSVGFIGEAFAAHGAQLSTHLFPAEGPLPAVRDADHLVVLGAIPSVYDDGAHRAWIEQELAWLRGAAKARVPVLGICFGAQALCAAFGGQVVAAARKEVGWTMVDTADPELIPAGPWLQFHGDRCLPPPEATILARNDIGVQAFSIGSNLAVQFHPEVDGGQLEQWMRAGARDEAARAGCDPDAFLADTVAAEPAARARAGILVATALRLARGDALASAPAQVSQPPPSG